jgi:hypothetical protein
VASVPEPEDEAEDEAPGTEPKRAEATTRHTEIQYHVLKLGAELGLEVWVARNDRSKTYNGEQLARMANMLRELPRQFNDLTNSTIELIDVLWVKGNTIIAAFEIEATTSVYSGLLRMSDLLALQPNLELAIEKVKQEITRPTFAFREKPLPKVCGFTGFTTLMEKVEGIRRLGLAGASSQTFSRPRPNTSPKS